MTHMDYCAANAGALADLTDWAHKRGLAVRAILDEVELLSEPRGLMPIIARSGRSKDEAARFVINCLSRLGIEVPR